MRSSYDLAIVGRVATVNSTKDWNLTDDFSQNS